MDTPKGILHLEIRMNCESHFAKHFYSYFQKEGIQL